MCSPGARLGRPTPQPIGHLQPPPGLNCKRRGFGSGRHAAQRLLVGLLATVARLGTRSSAHAYWRGARVPRCSHARYRPRTCNIRRMIFFEPPCRRRTGSGADVSEAVVLAVYDRSAGGPECCSASDRLDFTRHPRPDLQRPGPSHGNVAAEAIDAFSI